MEFSGKKIMIIGAGLSGIAAADLISDKLKEEKDDGKTDLILFDANSKKALNEEGIRKKLNDDFQGRIVLNDIPDDCRQSLDLLILSPGVPRDLPFVVLMEKKGTKVIGEIELAYYFAKGKIVGITGTNGKTTTTALTGHILSKTFENTIVVGNIGTPYTELVYKTTDDGVTVAELSSFQLDTIETFRPDVSMVLNITPDHLDRHHTMKNYIAAKMNVASNQNEDDICVLNYEDATLREYAKGLKPRVVWFSSKRSLDDGLFYDSGRIWYAKNGENTLICETEKLQLIGTHNYENVMAAVAAALHFNVPLETLRDALYSFRPVEHRIEYVATKGGVKYYNDSKGTNPDASIQAVKAMNAPTYLIGGGYDKGADYSEWIECFGDKIKHLVLMGATREAIAECARKHGFNAITFVESMEEAVDFCSKNAVSGENVLLSPCCASWGMFKNYEERGRIFKELVNALR
ncbi:MAG: UDP-N-acetylmuramoyl-L-alanine--D-glutamate ligase [Lachnospiraceae bacterium]|nr:UDP-N-acetylmuramoyl-L-alanine--D-glutamate ligase [Lachnospiraceae bacterium]